MQIVIKFINEHENWLKWGKKFYSHFSLTIFWYVKVNWEFESL